MMFGVFALLAMAVGSAHQFGLLPYYHTIEVMWVQDFSNSFEKHLPTIRSEFRTSVDKLKWVFSHSRFGLAGYVDKPIEPFGYEKSKDYCFALKYPLTRYTDRLYKSFEMSLAHSGGDWEEATLDALIGAALNPETHWSTNQTTPNGYVIHKIVTVVTDGGYHAAGDSKLPRNKATGLVNCTGEDYPSIQQVATVLNQTDVTPIFLVTSPVAPIYKDLVEKLNVPTSIVKRVADDFTDLHQKFEEALLTLLRAKCTSQNCGEPCTGPNCDQDKGVVIHVKQKPSNLQVLLN